MSQTKIEWTDRTWSPVTGCTKISDGCKNCYAERQATRLERMLLKYINGFDVTCHPETLNEPLKWRKPTTIFVCSMGDLFHKDVPFEFIDRVFAVMALSPQHTFQVLTKRPELMREYMNYDNGSGRWGYIEGRAKRIDREQRLNRIPPNVYLNGPFPHVWLGVTAENQEQADKRIPILLQTPAAIRFVSIEPMLEEIDISHYLNGMPELQGGENQQITREMATDAGYPEMEGNTIEAEHSWIQTAPPLDWVIVGEESGVGRRTVDADHIRKVVRDCTKAKVPVFLKQMNVDGKLVKMPKLDSKEYREMPE